MLKFNKSLSEQAMTNLDKAKKSLNSAKVKKGNIPSDYSLAGDLSAIYSGIDRDLGLLDKTNSVIGANAQKNNKAEGENERLVAEMMAGIDFAEKLAPRGKTESARLLSDEEIPNLIRSRLPVISGTGKKCMYYTNDEINYENRVFVFGSGTGGELADYVESVQTIVRESRIYGEVIGVSGVSNSEFKNAEALANELVKYNQAGVDMVAYSGSGEMEFAAAILTIQQGGKINTYTSLDSTGRLQKMKNGTNNIGGSRECSYIATYGAAAYAWMASKRY
ncbi:MAG: hypothetical protein IKP28_00250 [Clostridia bacterium]|nr:hypothetical protein [Clostridia bacterium]